MLLLSKPIRLFVTLTLIGIGIWALSPYFYNNQVSEKLEDINITAQTPQSMATSSSQTAEPKLISQGTFQGLAGHTSQGTVKVLAIDNKNYLRFENDFSVTNGPDLFVHFGKDGAYDSNARIEKLKGNAGSQNYEIPNNLNLNDFTEVWIWCRAFSIPFAKALLN